MSRFDTLMNTPSSTTILVASHSSPSTEKRKVRCKRGPFRHTETGERKTLILLAYVCYKRLLQKERRSRAPTTDEVKDAHRVCTRVHGRPTAPPPAGRPHHRRLHADFPRRGDLRCAGAAPRVGCRAGGAYTRRRA